MTRIYDTEKAEMNQISERRDPSNERRDLFRERGRKLAVFSWQLAEAVGNWQSAAGKLNVEFWNAVTESKILAFDKKISRTCLPDLFHSICPLKNIRITRFYLQLMNSSQLSLLTSLVSPRVRHRNFNTAF